MDYDEIRLHGNAGHRNDCRYHSDNLPRAPEQEAWIAVQAAVAARAFTAPQVAAPQIEVAEDEEVVLHVINDL